VTVFTTFLTFDLWFPDFTKYYKDVDPGTAFQSTNQIWRTSLQFMASLGFGASTSVLFTYYSP